MSDKLFVNHDEMVSWIVANGTKLTAMIGGEMGIGKTAVGRTIGAKLNMDYTYIDCANMSLGDTSMPVIDRERRCTEYFPNEVFKLHTSRPVVLVIDEFTKGSREAQNMLLPVIEDRRLGSTKLHPDSIVIATGNMPDEGLGDKILPHQTDRFVLFNMRKPTPDEWLAWAAENSIEPTVMAFVDQYPDVLKSYHDDPHGENKYIFHPKIARNKVVTPRSLEKVSTQLKCKELVSENTLYASLVGTVGSAAAADLLAFVAMNDKLPHISAITADPAKAEVPKDVTARILLIYNLIMRVEKDTLENVLKYVTRKEFNEELQALFINKILCMPSKSSWAAHHKAMVKQVKDLSHFFTV
jgi:hypothetical protein